jgi:hypothetical protein
MIHSLRALITRNGTVVRSGLAHAAPVVRYLHQVRHMAEYQVHYWHDGEPHRVTAEGFLTLYEVGTFSRPCRVCERLGLLPTTAPYRRMAKE